MFSANVDRGRSLTLQALAQLESHSLASYHELFLRGEELRRVREAERDDLGGAHSPAAQRDRWADDVEEDIGEEDAEEEE